MRPRVYQENLFRLGTCEEIHCTLPHICTNLHIEQDEQAAVQAQLDTKFGYDPQTISHAQVYVVNTVCIYV